jgi:iron complex outermembrane receptor protein
MLTRLLSKRHALGVALAAFVPWLSFAQTAPAPVDGAAQAAKAIQAPQPAEAGQASIEGPATVPLAPVIVTGNPLRSGEVATPSSVLSGDGLVLRRASTLGETLDGLPGVSSSWFGPNANRPVIRGQDGDRIRVLANAGASLDASSLSFDHAVPIDPLVVERIEVLRGPAALLYGGGAVGGVVNAIDNRIPRAAVDKLGGAAELRLGGAAAERGGGVLIEAGAADAAGSGYALHADAFARRTDDLRVPPFDRPTATGRERRDRIVNSASHADGGALGGSLVWDRGYLGAAVDSYRNNYGTVAEEDVTIRMKRDKLAVAGELRDLAGPFRTVRGQVQHTVYEHQEVEGTGAVGTTFDNQGTDSRFEFEHAPLALPAANLRGVLGLQTERARFSALGEEAFVPSTKTTQAAAFVFEEATFGGPAPIKLSVGGRLERTRVESDGDAADASTARFGPAASRAFDTGSAALGGVVPLAPQWQLSANLAYTERAPTYAELFANGVHVATHAFERGNADAAKEKGANLDVALQWKDGASSLKAGAFSGRYANYITLAATGEPDFIDAGGEAFPVYAFTGVPARLSGLEFEGRWRALDGPQQLDVDGKLDLTRGSNRATGEPLPRIAPLRATLGINWGQGPWTARGEVVHAATQARVSADDTPTAGWTMVNLQGSYAMKLGGADGLLFAKLTNLGNVLGYNAASVPTVRALSPLPGRAAMAGLRVSF